jgi:hypothetical protein
MFTYGQVDFMYANLFGVKSTSNVIPKYPLLGSNAGLPPYDTPDLWSKDGQYDIGIEPNDTTEVMWASTDIWVRNAPDGEEIQIHENPTYRPLEEDSPNYVYVRVRNRGCNDAISENVSLYWAKASGGLRWPEPWTSTDGVLGGEIGIKNIADEIERIEGIRRMVIQGGESVIIQFEWDPPNPDDYEQYNLDKAHFCLLAHIGVPPPAIGDQAAVYDNLPDMVRALNDVVWKNVSVVTDGDLVTDVGLLPDGMIGDEYGVSGDDGADPSSPGSVFDWAKVKLDLGAELLARWQDYGSEGTDIEFDPSTGLIELKSSGAEIRGLPITEEEFFGVRVFFEPRAGSGQPLKTGLDVYQLDLHRTAYPYDEPIGTQQIQVKTRIPSPIIIIVE